MPRLNPKTVSKLDIPQEARVRTDINKSGYINSIISKLQSERPSAIIDLVWINPTIDPTNLTEFYIVIKYKNENNSGNYIRTIFYGVIFSNSSIASYKYCYDRSDMIAPGLNVTYLDQWFNEFKESSVTMPYTTFENLLLTEGLTVSKQREGFWKDPKNLNRTLNALKTACVHKQPEL